MLGGKRPPNGAGAAAVRGNLPLSYKYNLGGLLTQETYPSGRQVTYAYDCAGRVVGIAGAIGSFPTTYAGGAPSLPGNCSNSPTNAIGWAPQSAVLNMPLGNNLVESWTYNSRLQAQNIQVQQGSNSLWSLQNYFCTASAPACASNNGNVISQTQTVPITPAASASWTTAYTYDGVNRITGATETGTGLPGWGQTYAYGGQFGNLVLSDPNAVTFNSGLTCGSYNPSTNRCNASGFTYDSAGNLVNLLTLVMQYDAEARQTSITQTGATSTYLYDAEGRRVQKVSGGQTTTYVYDAMGNLAAEIGGTDAPDCATCYLTPDHLGSTRLITDANGNVVGRYDYTPFGSEIGPSFRTVNGTALAGYGADWVNPKFTGKPRDYETTLGLDYFGERYFSSAQGRFTTPDPLLNSGRPDYPQSWNRYSYVRNSPLVRIDPNGLYDFAPCGKGDSTCQGKRDRFNGGVTRARELLQGLDPKSAEAKALSKALGALGKAGDRNGVTVTFGQTKTGGQMETIGLQITVDFTAMGAAQKEWRDAGYHVDTTVDDGAAELGHSDSTSGVWNESWANGPDKERLQRDAIKDGAKRSEDRSNQSLREEEAARVRMLSQGSFILLAGLVCAPLVAARDSGGENVYSVCGALKNSAKLNGRTVVIEATLEGDLHSVLLVGEDCGRGIYLAHEWGRPGPEWKALDQAITRRASGLNKSVVGVVVEGVFRSRVPLGRGYIRQLQVSRVLKVRVGDAVVHQ